MRALSLYRGLPWRVRARARLAAWTTPLGALASRAPAEGRVLELGCRHGLFANALALAHPRLEVLGVDPEEDEIRWAQATVSDRPGIAFRAATLAEVPERDFDAVAALDVLERVPPSEWPELLAGCFQRLRSGGRLLLKDVDAGPGWKRALVRGGRLWADRQPAFADVETMRALLHAAGFWDVCVTVLGHGYLTPHVLYEGVRPE